MSIHRNLPQPEPQLPSFNIPPTNSSWIASPLLAAARLACIRASLDVKRSTCHGKKNSQPPLGLLQRLQSGIIHHVTKALNTPIAPTITVTASRRSANTPSQLTASTTTHDVRVIAIETGRTTCRCLGSVVIVRARATPGQITGRFQTLAPREFDLRQRGPGDENVPAELVSQHHKASFPPCSTTCGALLSSNSVPSK
jgi:hypothetical protein